MASEGEVGGGGGDGIKLLGAWSSSYTHRVQVALKLKGVEYEYVEEDLRNKSPLLLQSNPVHKKVPVLLVAGEAAAVAIAESVVILEYVEERWRERYPIMPTDLYERAVVRFWCHFADDKLGPAVGEVFRTAGEAQEAAAGRARDSLKTVESELAEGFFKGRRFFGGDGIGLLDIVMGCGSFWLWALEEVAGVKLVDPATFPRFHSWLQDFEEQAPVKEITPPADRLLQYAKALRQMILLNQSQP